MKLLSASARRRLLRAAAVGGCVALGVAQLRSRRQALLRPGPLPEEREDTGGLDALVVSTLSRAPGLSLTWDKRIVVQWAASDDHALGAQYLVDLGVHRVALSCLKDACPADGVVADGAAAVDALRVLARITDNALSRRALINCMGHAHWGALVTLQVAAGGGAEEGLARVLGRLLANVEADMAARPDPLALYEGLELGKQQPRSVFGPGPSGAGAFALGLRAVSAPLPAAAPTEPGALVLPLLGLSLLAQYVGTAAAAGGVGPVMDAISVHAAALPGALDAAAAAGKLGTADAAVSLRDGGSAELGSTLWLRALSAAAAAMAREARLTALDAGSDARSVPPSQWISVGLTCLLGVVAVGPAAAAVLSGGSRVDESRLEGQERAVRAGIDAAIAISELLASQPAPAACWGRLAAPALHAFALQTLAPVALADVYELPPPAGGASRAPHVVQGLCGVLADALTATLACFPPALRCELALVRPTPEMLAPWLDVGVGRQRLRDAHALALVQLTAATANPGGAASAPRLLPPACIPGAETREERAASPSDRTSPHIDEDAATATVLGVPGALVSLREDLASSLPSPRAKGILQRGYGPLVTPALRGGALPEFFVLRRSRETGCSAGGGSSAEKSITLRVLPSAVDLLCGITRNLSGTGAADAAEGALARLLTAHEEAATDGHRLAGAQVLIAQAWLVSALSGAVDLRAQGAAGPATAERPRRLSSPVAASAVRELLRWVRRHTEPLPPAATAHSAAPSLPPPPWRLREGAPVDLLPPFVAEKIIAPAFQARTTAEVTPGGSTSRRVHVFDELALPYVHASSAFHVHLLKSLAYLPSVPRDGPNVESGRQHMSAALALRLAEQGIFHPLLFIAQFYTDGLTAWQRSADSVFRNGNAAESLSVDSGLRGSPRPVLRLQMDPGYREAVSALRQCLRLCANIAYALRPPSTGELDAPDSGASKLIRESWGASAAAWRAPCETSDALEDLKLHCHAVRLLYNLEALALSSSSELPGRFKPSYGDSTMPLLPLPGSDGSGSEADRPIDLVFVHGLQGAGLKTWRSGSGWCASHDPDDDGFGGSNGFPFYCLSTKTHATGRRVPLWPAVWLAPAAAAEGLSPRPLVLVYDSDVWSSDAVRPLRSLEEVAFELCCQLRDAGVGVASLPAAAPAPVVFVGHSMGGLVIKFVLTGAAALAAADAPGGPWVAFALPAATAGITFIATPHAGSPVASWMCRRLSTVHRWLPGGGSQTAGPWAAPLLGLLREQNADLAALDSEFQRVLWGGSLSEGGEPTAHQDDETADADALSSAVHHDASSSSLQSLRSALHRSCGQVAVLSLVEGSPLPVFSSQGASDAAAGATSPLGPVPAKIISPPRTPTATVDDKPSAIPALPAPTESQSIAGRFDVLRGQIVRVFEAPRAAVIVVPEASACPGYGLCAVIRGADHVQVCKPDSAGAGDARFALISELVSEAALGAGRRSSSASSSVGNTGCVAAAVGADSDVVVDSGSEVQRMQ